jgi:hypothetical protein
VATGEPSTIDGSRFDGQLRHPQVLARIPRTRVDEAARLAMSRHPVDGHSLWIGSVRILLEVYMRLSSSIVRSTARFAALLPFALLSTACSDGNTADTGDPTTANGGNANSDDVAANGNGGASNTNGAANGSGATTNGSANNGGSAATTTPDDEDDPLGPAPVSFGTASDYVILAQSAITNVPTSVITGDLGLSPAAASYVTGFALTRAGTSWTSPEVTGSIFAADNDATTPSDLTTAVGDMQTAYNDAAGREGPTFLNLEDGAIGGLTLVPGLYRWTSTVTIPSDVTLAGASDDVWIFQITGDLTLSADQAMTLTGGARAKNIVWQVAGVVDLAATSHSEGIMLSKTAINMGTGASINGRLLAQTAVTIASATITAPP